MLDRAAAIHERGPAAFLRFITKSRPAKCKKPFPRNWSHCDVDTPLNCETETGRVNQGKSAPSGSQEKKV